MATVLIVEDDRHVLFITDCALKGAGHKTVTAASVDDACSVLRSGEQIDAVVADINLDGDERAGLKVAKDAVKRQPGVGVIYTTAGQVRGPFVRDSEFLPKPYTSRQLAQAVEAAIHKAKARSLEHPPLKIACGARKPLAGAGVPSSGWNMENKPPVART